jgi:small subunit ribosomal protein S16
MSVVIRMKRMGRTNRPTYRISVAHAPAKRDGRTLETIGHYDPASSVKDLQLKIDLERARFWIDHGARPSPTVASILRRLGATKDRPPKKVRSRPGRKKDTKTRARREERKKGLLAAKQQRLAARVAEKQAKKAAKSEGEKGAKAEAKS